MMSRRNRAGLVSILALIAGAGSLTAQEWKSSYTLFGTPGLIEMPTAGRLSDGTLSTTVGHFGDQTRTTVTFQATPRLTASFRYSRMATLDYDDFDYYDRSFDLQYRVLDETDRLPALAIGLRDFLGTGLYSSEYIVATKTFGSRLQATAGVGWGQLGGRGGFDNPFAALFGDRFNERSLFEVDTGGTVNGAAFFRGDAAFFGGIEYTISPSLRFKAEYSSDEYIILGKPVFDQKSPFNFGLTYSPSEHFHIGAYSINGSEFGVGATVSLDPHARSFAPPLRSAPLPVAVRPANARAAATWAPDTNTTRQFGDALAEAMKTEGLILRGVEARGNTLRIRYENNRYAASAEAMGRLTRMLTHAAAPSVDYFELEQLAEGIPVSNVRLSRSAVEQLDNELGAVERLWETTQITAAKPVDGLVPIGTDRPRLSWGINPYFSYTLFDLDNPIQYHYGVQGDVSYEFAPNLVASAQVRYKLGGSQGEPEDRRARGDWPLVRRDVSKYGRESDLTLQHMTLSHYGRLGPDVYTRASLGYFEKQFGGVSGEVLWKPVGSRLALGAELNYAIKRDPAMDFGFTDFKTTSGHLSAYYEFDNDYVGQVDVGRYLAGDWGATVSLDREFPNGWKVGGYFTVTNMPFDDFGTGSFDKGVRVTIPTEWLIGRPSRSSQQTTLVMGARDGGQRVRISDRLYPIVREGHERQLEANWGRFWQ